MLSNLSKSHGIEYVAHSILGEAKVIIEFAGQFQERPIIWKATIIALNANNQRPQKQYIEVEEYNNGDFKSELKVEIGLPVKIINEPTVLKTITMLRQFKNLRVGRHEFEGVNK